MITAILCQHLSFSSQTASRLPRLLTKLLPFAILRCISFTFQAAEPLRRMNVKLYVIGIGGKLVIRALQRMRTDNMRTYCMRTREWEHLAWEPDNMRTCQMRTHQMRTDRMRTLPFANPSFYKWSSRRRNLRNSRVFQRFSCKIFMCKTNSRKISAWPKIFWSV